MRDYSAAKFIWTSAWGVVLLAFLSISIRDYTIWTVLFGFILVLIDYLGLKCLIRLERKPK